MPHEFREHPVPHAPRRGPGGGRVPQGVGDHVVAVLVGPQAVLVPEAAPAAPDSVGRPGLAVTCEEEDVPRARPAAGQAVEPPPRAVVAGDDANGRIAVLATPPGLEVRAD